MVRIFVTRRIPAAALEVLRSAFSEEVLEVFEPDRAIRREELLASVAGCEAILSMLTDRIDDEVYEAAGPSLRIVANCAVGYNNIDVPAATRRGVLITNTPDVLTESTADLAWALILGASRRAGEGERFLRAGRWDSWSPEFMLGYDVYGKTLGIFGLGRIGGAVARRARGFGMNTLYHARKRLSVDEEAELCARYVSKDELLAESDILTLHCPLTDETRHAFGVAEFARMKPTAVFVNTTRGPVVDEAALAEALQSGKIFAAGLDVYEREPIVHPELLKCENAFLLPHLGSATRETRTAMARLAVENIVATLNGRPPKTSVNREALR
jgi:glyoxylate reductase